MSRLDADAIRQRLDEATLARLAELEVFAEIDSTNSYLMQQAGPLPGQVHVALTDNQTAGRGRYGRRWQSPPGSGLCLSMAYTFSRSPSDLPALTLAIGLGVISTLKALGITGVQLKWPNDLIALDGKLGGILTEAHNRSSGAMTIVTGIGLNIDVSEDLALGAEANGVRGATNLKNLVSALPSRNRLAACLVGGLDKAFVDFEANGFAPFVALWPEHDWLFGREVTIDTAQQQINGIVAGVGEDGALLLDTEAEGRHRVTSGSVVMARTREAGS